MGNPLREFLLPKALKPARNLRKIAWHLFCHAIMLLRNRYPLKTREKNKTHPTYVRCAICLRRFAAGGERGIWTLAPVTQPTPLAGEPLHHLGISPKRTVWRRGRDSNPWHLRVTGFQDQLLKPLGHLSLSQSQCYLYYHKEKKMSITFFTFFEQFSFNTKIGCPTIIILRLARIIM